MQAIRLQLTICIFCPIFKDTGQSGEGGVRGTVSGFMLSKGPLSAHIYYQPRKAGRQWNEENVANTCFSLRRHAERQSLWVMWLIFGWAFEGRDGTDSIIIIIMRFLTW